MKKEQTLSDALLAIGPIAASAAVGDMENLGLALNEGLDAGLTVNEIKEILVQLYAYAGFPRSLNAIGALMKVVAARGQCGIVDVIGREPRGAIPTGAALLTSGTANQTKLSGTPVTGPLFEFAPAIDLFLKTHLFGDIFERDNLTWQSRELATVAALAALPGLDAQLLAHIRISLNVGLTRSQLADMAHALCGRGNTATGRQIESVIDRHFTEHAEK